MVETGAREGSNTKMRDYFFFLLYMMRARESKIENMRGAWRGEEDKSHLYMT